MALQKKFVWGLSATLVLAVIGYAGYHFYEGKQNTNLPAHQVALAAFNTQEDKLTTETESVYNDLQPKFEALQKGTLTPAEFKTQMEPLNDRMAKNWDAYKSYTDGNGLSDQVRQTKEFQDGVALASQLRLQMYTFLLNVTTYDLSKEEIVEKYNDTLKTFSDDLKRYRDVTKGLAKS